LLIINEGRTDGKVVKCAKYKLEEQMRQVTKTAEIGGLTLKTFRKDFAIRARIAGASKDDVNLIQGRDESVLEHHYTTDEWFIVHTCRPWMEKMFEESSALRVVK
jgi:hypothetical protein